MERAAIAELPALSAGQDSPVTVQQAASLDITPTLLRAALDRVWIRQPRHGVFVAAGGRAVRVAPGRGRGIGRRA
jgi:hypothetical protein